MALANRKRQVAIDVGSCRCIGPSPAWAELLGYGRRLESSGVFFTAGKSFEHQEPVGSDAQTCVMVEATPAAALVVPQPQLLLEFFVVALNPPASHNGINHQLPWHGLGKVAEPVVCRLRCTLGPLDDQPFVPPGLVTVCCRHPHARKARTQRRGHALAPRHGTP